MDKIQLLEYLDTIDHVDANEIVTVMQVSYAASAMALLRLVRQDLSARHRDPDTELYVYEITPKGEARLDYFFENELNDD